MHISWSALALESITEIIDYYEDVAGIDVADRAEGEIFGQVEAIKDFPKRIAVSEVFPTLRRLVIQDFPYAVFLRIGDDVIEVIDVVHTSRKLPKETR